MKHKLAFSLLSLLLAPTVMASSIWHVDGMNGSDGNNCKSRQSACKTIGHAISLASSGDSIMVAAATYTENLSIRFSLMVIGSGAATTIIDGGRVNTVVSISNTGATVILSKLTIQNGHATLGGGISNSGTLSVHNSTITGNSASGGGGINSSGTLTINNSIISGNGASVVGAGIRNSGRLRINTSTITGNNASPGGFTASGGGIYNGGTLTINNSTISGNTVGGNGGLSFAKGGGIYNGGTLTINNSTIASNVARTRRKAAYGGGIFARSMLITINNSTIASNSVKGSGAGGGIAGTITLRNSIVANNWAPDGGANCYGSDSKGYNLSSDGTCHFNNTGDLNNTDPKLGSLGNYGGPTRTMPLLPGSPAVDAGNPSGCTDGDGHLLKTDQRGKPRPDKEDTGGCDMGAYEYQAQQGHCIYVCGSTRCGELTGYCSISTGNACRQVFDPRHCPRGQHAREEVTDPCGFGVDPTRTCGQ